MVCTVGSTHQHHAHVDLSDVHGVYLDVLHVIYQLCEVIKNNVFDQIHRLFTL